MPAPVPPAAQPTPPPAQAAAAGWPPACRSTSSLRTTRPTTPAPTWPPSHRQSGARFLSLAFLETAAPARARRTGTATPASRSPPPTLRQRHRRDPGGGRQRHPVVRRLHRRHHRAPTSPTAAPASPAIAAGLREPDHHLPRPAHRPGCRGGLADQHCRDQPAQRGHREVEAWAAAHHLQHPVLLHAAHLPHRADRAGLAVLQNAVADGARISTVNLLTFDYFIGTQQNMAD